MWIGWLELDLLLGDVHSLKAKRVPVFFGSRFLRKRVLPVNLHREQANHSQKVLGSGPASL